MTTSTLKTSKRIHNITLRRMLDKSPDTSWLGEYSNHPTSEYSIDRKHKEGCDYFNTDHMEDCDCGGGDMGRNEYRYFNPGNSYDGCTPEEIQKYVRQDYERMEALNRGDWYFVGVRAEAQYSLGKTYLRQTLTSGGLWGIESDSGDYFAEVEEEQLSELRSQLEAIGFSKRAVSAAFRNIERRES